jgi:hypothetical protein
MIWHYLRSYWLANSVFISLADIMEACQMAPLALRGRLGFSFARSIGGSCYVA